MSVEIHATGTDEEYEAAMNAGRKAQETRAILRGEVLAEKAQAVLAALEELCDVPGYSDPSSETEFENRLFAIGSPADGTLLGELLQAYGGVR